MILRRQRAQNALSLIGAVLPLAGLVLAVTLYRLGVGEPQEPFALFFGSVAGAMILVLFSLVVARWGPTAAMVTITEREILLGLPERSKTISRDAISTGVWMPVDRSLHLTLRNGQILEIGLQDAEEDEVMARLGVGPEQRHAVVEEQRRVAKAGMGCAGALTLVPWAAVTAHIIGRPIGMAGLWLVVGATLLTILVFRRSMDRRPVRVGVDGVTTRRLRTTRRWPIPSIASVDADRDALVITDSAGTRERVRVGPSAARAARDRVRALMDACNTLAPERVGALDELLSVRGGRRDRLVKLLSGAAEYRGAAWSAADLVALVADPRVSRGKRVGAAWALGLAWADADKDRARVASARIGQPELRLAVVRALEDRLADVELEALAAAEAAEASAIAGKRAPRRD